jgi:ferredoxin
MKRDIIRIDESKCNGCGLCASACAEGALAIVDGKAKIVGEILCDGLGACLGECPTGALTIEQRDADAFDEAAVAHRAKIDAAPQGGCPGSATRQFGSGAAASPAAAPHAAMHAGGGGCPGSAVRQFGRAAAGAAPAPAAGCASACGGASEEAPAGAAASALTHWPIQLHLARTDTPVFQGAEILIAADCTAFALGGFHGQLLAGKRLLIACPKLDDPAGYLDKLTALFAVACPQSVTVARMEVPCCSGLMRLALQAREAAGSDLPVREVIVGVEGEILSERSHPAAVVA